MNASSRSAAPASPGCHCSQNPASHWRAGVNSSEAMLSLAIFGGDFGQDSRRGRATLPGDALAGIPPERREHPVRRVAKRCHRPRLDQQRRVEALDMQASRFERVLDHRVARDRRRFVQAIPEYGFDIELGGQLLQFGKAWAAPDDQAGTGLLQVAGKRAQRTVQPRLRGRPRLPGLFLARRMDIDGYRREAGVECGLQRRVVGQAQVSSKPDDGAGHQLAFT